MSSYFGPGGGGSGGSPGGDNTEVQYNNNGSFSGIPGTTYDDGNSEFSAFSDINAAVSFFSTVTFEGLTGTPTMGGHDHSEGGMTAIDSGGIAAQAITPSKVDGSGGTNGQVLQTDGSASGVSWGSAGSGSPGGNDTELQYNNGGNFGGVAGTTYDDANTEFSAFSDINATIQALQGINFPNITGTPSFASHDHSEGGLNTIPNAGLTNDSVTYSAGVGIDGAGSVALGNSTGISVGFGDDEDLDFGASDDFNIRYDATNTQLELESADVDGGGTTGNILRVPDGQQNVDFLSDIAFPNITGTPNFSTHDHSEGGMSTIPNGGLANDSVTVGTNSPLSGGGSATLGGAGLTLDVGLGNGVEDNAGSIRVNPADIAGDGLKEASATSMSVEPADIAGSFLSDDGSDNLQVNLGEGLEGDGSDNIKVKEPYNYSPGHTEWEDALSSEEIDRIVLQTGETLVVERIEFRQKGGGSSTSASIDVRDTTAATTIGSQNLGGTTKDPGSSGSGNTIIVRLNNSTGGTINAAPRVIGYIEGA